MVIVGTGYTAVGPYREHGEQNHLHVDGVSRDGATHSTGEHRGQQVALLGPAASMVLGSNIHAEVDTSPDCRSGGVCE